MFLFRCFIFLGVVFLWAVQTVEAQIAPPVQAVSLDYAFRESNGIFMPQQSVILDVMLRAPNASAPYTLRATLIDLSLPNRPALNTFSTQITPHVSLPISFVTPYKEGPYEIVLAAVQEGMSSRLPMPMGQREVLASRQFVVISPHVSSRRVGDWILSEQRELPLVDASFADSPSRRLLPHFPKVGELPRIADFPRSAGVQRVQTLVHEAGSMLKLPHFGRRDASTLSPDELEQMLDRYYTDSKRHFLRLPALPGYVPEPSEQYPSFFALAVAEHGNCVWYSLPIEVELGKPYLVEIDYPVGVPQTLGVAIVDGFSHQEHDGGFEGIVNSAVNIHVAEEMVQDTPTETTATHRLLFWGGTEQPELVFVNRQPHRQALFRNIRVSQITSGRQDDQRFPRLFEAGLPEGQTQRKRIGQFLGTNAFQHLANSSLSRAILSHEMSWQEAYDGCSRLMDILCRGGYDGVTLTVCSADSALCPIFTLDGQEANKRLNVLEMMFQRFDGEGLTLIPAIQFDMPIPSLERLLQQYPAAVEEILMGNPEHRLYNLLHPDVQQAMAEVVRELVARFQHHSSFGGVAIILSPETYAQLPFIPYPPDDYTFAQFRQEMEHELGISFPEEQRLRQTMPMQQFLAQKGMERLRFLHSNPQIWEAWIRWRMAKVSRFYTDLAQQVSAQRADAPLYLLGGTMLDQAEIQDFCVPTLPRNFTPLQALRRLGFDPSLLNSESLHFLRPVQISETKQYRYESLNSADTASLFSKSGSLSGVQFVHTDTHYFVTTPAHVQSRKRFVRQLAQADVLMFMDGGVSLPFGQETALFDLLNTYRRIPPVSFLTFQPPAENPAPLQPLIVRYKNLPDGMIVYIINDAPVAVEADFLFSARPGSSMTELTGQRMIRSFSNVQRSDRYGWRASLLPYDLLALRISDPNADIVSVSVHHPPALCSTNGILKQKVDELSQRIQTARNGLLWEGLTNADFELHTDAAGGIVGWQCFGTLNAQLDQANASKGQHSVRLTNGSAEAGTFLSHPFNIPATGRLGISMFVGIPENASSLPMAVILTAKHRGQIFNRIVPVGESLMPSLAKVEPNNGVRWHRLVVPFEHLPLESLEEVRIGVQYLGNGTLWLDDITLSPVRFSRNEIAELQKMLFVAAERHSAGRISDLTSLLEDYWTQFLFQHIPASTPQPAIALPKPPVATETPPPPKPTWYQRVRGLFGG
jgi:hypothetical protein